MLFDYSNVKSVLWHFSLGSQRPIADTRFTSAAKFKQQENLDCYMARNNYQQCNLLSNPVSSSNPDRDKMISVTSCYLHHSRIRCTFYNQCSGKDWRTHILWKYFGLHHCCHSHRSSLSTPSFNRRETSAICFPLDEWSAMVLPHIMPEWGRASSKTTS